MDRRDLPYLRLNCCLILLIHLNPPQYGRRAILSSHLTILKMARTMHQYRRAARRGLWDAEINRAAEDDGNTNYNPFFTRATRANRRLDVTSNDTDGPQSKLDPPLGLRQDEADLEPHFYATWSGERASQAWSRCTTSPCGINAQASIAAQIRNSWQG